MVVTAPFLPATVSDVSNMKVRHSFHLVRGRVRARVRVRVGVRVGVRG